MPDQNMSSTGSVATLDEIFLTPRVIDGESFGRYSGILRELIETGQQTGAMLRAQRERAEQVYERYIEPREQAGKGEAKNPENPSADSAPVVADAAAARIARLEATVAELAGRLEQAEAKADEAKTLATSNEPNHGVVGVELSPELDEAMARSEQAQGKLQSLIAKAEEAGDELGSKIGDVIAKAATQGAELTAMIMMLAEQIERAEALPELDNVGKESAARLQALIEQSSTIRTQGTERVEELEQLCSRADASGEALLRAVRAATDSTLQAQEIAARIEREAASRPHSISEHVVQPFPPAPASSTANRYGNQPTPALTPPPAQRPSPIAPGMPIKPTLRRPDSPIDGEDFSSAPTVIRQPEADSHGPRARGEITGPGL